MKGMAAPPALHGQGRGISFSKRDIPPLDPPRENCIASLQHEEVRRLGSGSALRGGIASLAAIGGCETIWCTSTTRCRSADLAQVQPNFLLSAVQAFSVVPAAASTVLPHSTDSANKRGERSNAAPVGTCKADNIRSRRKLQKAAESQAERQRVVGVDQIVLQQHLAGTRLRSACSSSSPNPAMRGSRGTPLAFLWGFQRGYSLRKENTPFVPQQRQKALPSPPRGARKLLPPMRGAQKKSRPFRQLPFTSLPETPPAA